MSIGSSKFMKILIFFKFPMMLREGGERGRWAW